MNFFVTKSTFSCSDIYLHLPTISHSSLSHSRLAAPEVVASSGRTTIPWKVSVPFLLFFGLMPECIIVVYFRFLGFSLIESYFFVWYNEMKTYMLEYTRLHLKSSRSCFCRIIRFCNTTSYCDFNVFLYVPLVGIGLLNSCYCILDILPTRCMWRYLTINCFYWILAYSLELSFLSSIFLFVLLLFKYSAMVWINLEKDLFSSAFGFAMK